jgi:hypothetical protein
VNGGLGDRCEVAATTRRLSFSQLGMQGGFAWLHTQLCMLFAAVPGCMLLQGLICHICIATAILPGRSVFCRCKCTTWSQLRMWPGSCKRVTQW